MVSFQSKVLQIPVNVIYLPSHDSYSQPVNEFLKQLATQSKGRLG